MEWYEEHIESGDGVLRPYVKDTGLSVHRIMSLVDEAQLPQEVVQNDNAVHQLVADLEDDLDEDDAVTIHGTGDGTPELTITHVEAAIEFARDHPDLIRAIQQEQDIIDSVVFKLPEDAHEELQRVEFDHFDVDSTLDSTNGEAAVHFDIE